MNTYDRTRQSENVQIKSIFAALGLKLADESPRYVFDKKKAFTMVMF
jgi:hypothetical protein